MERKREDKWLGTGAAGSVLRADQPTVIPSSRQPDIGRKGKTDGREFNDGRQSSRIVAIFFSPQQKGSFSFYRQSK